MQANRNTQSGGRPLNYKAEQIPDYPWLTDPGWSMIHGLVRLQANHMALRENVLDLMHFGYAHAKTFEITDWGKPSEVTREGVTVSFIQRFEGELAPMYGIPTGIGMETTSKRVKWGKLVTRTIHISDVDITHPDPERQAEDELSLRSTHVTTPQTATRTLYFWTAAGYHGRETESIAALERAVAAAFDEDRVILEAIQRRLDEEPESSSWPGDERAGRPGGNYRPANRRRTARAPERRRNFRITS